MLFGRLGGCIALAFHLGGLGLGCGLFGDQDIACAGFASGRGVADRQGIEMINCQACQHASAKLQGVKESNHQMPSKQN